jgi:hypothetical protein
MLHSLTNMKKYSPKFFLIMFALLTASAFALSFVIQPRGEKERKQGEKYIKEFEEFYAKDTYGGKTPEETLELFISALEQGDTELARKYFVMEKQDEWGHNLNKIKSDGLLGDMVNDLRRNVSKNNISDGLTAFDFANKQNEASGSILIGKAPNNLWKITDL